MSLFLRNLMLIASDTLLSRRRTSLSQEFSSLPSYRSSWAAGPNGSLLSTSPSRQIRNPLEPSPSRSAESLENEVLVLQKVSSRPYISFLLCSDDLEPFYRCLSTSCRRSRLAKRRSPILRRVSACAFSLRLGAFGPST
jgi:hypothetical protein